MEEEIFFNEAFGKVNLKLSTDFIPKKTSGIGVILV